MPRQRAGKAQTEVGEVQRLVEILRLVIRTFGTHREVERKLGMRTGYLSRIFGGAVELRVEHILAVCRALELAPAEFFSLAFPIGPEAVTPAGKKLFAALQQPGPAAGSAAAKLRLQLQAPKTPNKSLTTEEVDAHIRTTMGEFLVAFGKLFGGSGQR